MFYKPLLIETCQYKYQFGGEEKSFTIKKKIDYNPYQYEKQINNSFHMAPNSSKQKKRQSTIEPTKYIDSDISIQRYIDFNIKEKTQIPNINQKVRRLIGQDQKLMRKQLKSRDLSDVMMNERKTYHRKQMKEKVVQMLDNESLFRKVDSPLISNRDNNNDINHSPEKQINDKVQNYLSRKSVHLQHLTQQADDMNMSKLSQFQVYPTEKDLKISSNFFKEFVGVSQKLQHQQKQQKDQELLQESYKYWAQALRTKKNNPFKNRKIGNVFSLSMKMKLQKMRLLLLECVKKLHFMKLEPNQLYNERIFLKNPYQREGSYIFFKGVGKNDIDLIKLMLEKCRYYAFDINENFQTALHICARKGHDEIAILLLTYGTYPDAKDLNNRTPLYYALINNQKRIVQLLLSHKCNPWSSDKCVYTTNDQILMKMLKIARRLDMLLMMTPYITRQVTWNKYCKIFYEF